VYCVQNSSFFLAITEIFSCVTSREESEVKIGMEIEGLKEATDDAVIMRLVAENAKLRTYESEEIKAMTIHTIPKHTCPSCGGEGEYLGALLDMSGQEEREYLFWKCLDCRQEWQEGGGKRWPIM